MSRVKKMLAVTAQECYPGCNTPVIVPNMLVLKSQRLLMSIIIIKMRNFYSTFQTRGTILEQTYSEFLEVIPQYKSLLEKYVIPTILFNIIPQL